MPLHPPDPPLADDAVVLEPLAQRHASVFPPGSCKTRRSAASRWSRTAPTGSSSPTGSPATSGAGGRGAAPASRSSTTGGRDRSASRPSSGSRKPGGEAEIGYFVAPEARGHGIAGRAVALLTRLGLRPPRPGADRAADRQRERPLDPGCETGRLPPPTGSCARSTSRRAAGPTSGSGRGCAPTCQGSRVGA